MGHCLEARELTQSDFIKIETEKLSLLRHLESRREMLLESTRGLRRLGGPEEVKHFDEEIERQ